MHTEAQVKCRKGLSMASAAQFSLSYKEVFRFQVEYVSVRFALLSLPVHAPLRVFHHCLHLLHHLGSIEESQREDKTKMSNDKRSWTTFKPSSKNFLA